MLAHKRQTGRTEVRLLIQFRPDGGTEFDAYLHSLQAVGKALPRNKSACFRRPSDLCAGA